MNYVLRIMATKADNPDLNPQAQTDHLQRVLIP